MKQLGLGTIRLTFGLVLLLLCLPLNADDRLGEAPFASLTEILPQTVADFEKVRLADLDAVAQSLDRVAAERTWSQRRNPPDQVLRWTAGLIDAKRQIDSHLDRLLAMRGGIAALPAANQRTAARGFLRVTNRLIDLSARLRYTLTDAIDNSTFELSENPAALEQLLDTLIAQRVAVSAPLMTFALFDPDKTSNLRPFPLAYKKKVLQLATITRNVETLPDLVKFLQEERPVPELALDAADAIRAIGLPQVIRPGQDPTIPPPVITPPQLARIVTQIPAADLPAEMQTRRDELITWLVTREKSGITEDSYRVGETEVQAGDWLLMRNPSPYNQFTDLSPGLFTHVGVVTVEQGADGIRRFVIVDLPERIGRMPATNVDIFLYRTLHYVFLRHTDSTAASRMSEAARSMIGNESQFDLQFRTDRVAALRGRPLRGQHIHTYCAGLLLICAQETGRPRQEFFPIPEASAGGNCLSNLAKLGMSIGNDFISPTGAIFSPHLKIVGRCEPMYDPGREVQETVFDHFAVSMVNKQLTPSPNLTQALREKVAGFSRSSPSLGRLFARANRVSEKTDLPTAARAAAVVETVDEIALGVAEGFRLAREAITAESEPSQPKQDPKVAQQMQAYRQRHADLYQRFKADKATPVDVRVELVKYYGMWGKQQLDARFFP